jgi:hypothetical protein
LSRPVLDSLRQPGVALGYGEAGRSLFALAEGFSFLLPLLGSLPVFFGIPTIWHDPSVSLGDSVVVIPTAQGFIKTKRLQNAPPDSLFWRNGHPTKLREKAMHFRRVALLLSDVEASEALLELAAEYESLADDLAEQEPNPRGR